MFGKDKNSLKRVLTIEFVIAILSVTLLFIIEFLIFVDPGVQNGIVTLDITDEKEIFKIIRRSLILAIGNMFIISIVLIKINEKKVIDPINQLNNATKKVTNGDYNIVLESNRCDEIGELTCNFNKMTKGLRSTENLQKEFINNVSHEIKTPISSIKGFATFLKDENLKPEEREEYANIIIEESDRLVNLTTKMLRLSKLYNQDTIINKQEISLDEQIRKAVNVLEPKWSKKKIKINVNLEEQIFIGDEDLMFQVWINVIENAIKFSNVGGKINIKLYKDDDKIVASIKDNGIGMQEDELEKIFERFYQIDKSHSEEGSGLGLAIVKRIITLSNGELKINSKENVGTEVIVKLPAENENKKIVIA